jgi:SNF2 family DNA or RNA helicase
MGELENPLGSCNLQNEDTVEERIHQLQAKKSQLADSLLSDAARAAAPDESTLSALLAPLG